METNKPVSRFEKFLEERCFSQNPSVLDDNMPDFFDNWLGELDGDDYIEYAEFFGRQCFLEGKEEMLKK